MPSKKPIVWLPYPVHESALALLAAHAEVVLGYGENKVPYEDVAAEVEGILIRTGKITAEHIASSPRLKVIARHGVGVDSVDVAAATAAGVYVTNTPDSNLVSVAEHATALMMSLRRKLTVADRANQRGESASSRSRLVGRELHRSTLGLIGFGRIAREFARIARAGFGMNIVAYDALLPFEAIESAGAKGASLQQVLEQADVLSLHVPLLPQTHHLLGTQQLESMKPEAIIINTARGGVIDEQALLVALEKGSLGGAALDVTEVEPLPAGHAFFSREDVIITPHVAGQTEESLVRVANDAAHNVLQALAGQTPSTPVNIPENPRAALPAI